VKGPKWLQLLVGVSFLSLFVEVHMLVLHKCFVLLSIFDSFSSVREDCSRFDISHV
jgi:hypothetical protein